MKTLVRWMAFLVPFLLACAQATSDGWFTKENAWERYTSLSFALPIISWDYDTDASDGESDNLVPLGFESTGYTFDYQAHHISPNKGFTVLTQWGFGGWRGDFELSDGTLKETLQETEDEDADEDEEEDAKEEYETFTQAGNTGFGMYFNVGFGKAFKLAGGRMIIIPTAGIGLNIYMLTKAEGTFNIDSTTDPEATDGTEESAAAAETSDSDSSDGTDGTDDTTTDTDGSDDTTTDTDESDGSTDTSESSSSSTQESYTYRNFDAVLNVFLNVTALFMFSEKYGLSLSCKLSVPVFGVGLCTTSSDGSDNATVYMLDRFSSVNFTPAVGLCIRL